jgi:hypothetical protein
MTTRMLDLFMLLYFITVSSTIKTYLHDITEILNIVETGAKHHKPNHRQCWLCDDFG